MAYYQYIEVRCKIETKEFRMEHQIDLLRCGFQTQSQRDQVERPIFIFIFYCIKTL